MRRGGERKRKRSRGDTDVHRGGWFGRVGLEGGKGMGGGRKCDERYFKAIVFLYKGGRRQHRGRVDATNLLAGFGYFVSREGLRANGFKV